VAICLAALFPAMFFTAVAAGMVRSIGQLSMTLARRASTPPEQPNKTHTTIKFFGKNTFLPAKVGIFTWLYMG
jgi:hypothetical protein